MNEIITGFAVDDFAGKLLLGRKLECQKTTNRFLKTGYSVIEIYEQLFREALYRVGLLWEMNKISVASEHLATAVVEGIMNDLYPEFISDKPIGRKVVLGCVENETHQVGIKMVSDIFEKHGWETFFLGSNVPNESLIHFIRSVNPDLLALSMSIYFNMAGMLKLLARLGIEFPQLRIIVGGQALNHTKETLITRYPDIKYFDSLPSLDSALFNNQLLN